VKNSTPFHLRVPREIRANLRWRKAVHKRILEDPAFAEVIREACARDPLFFINGFCWTYDPRCSPSKLPFILYQFQEQAILDLVDAICDHDLLVEKSRDMGATWLCIIALSWFWMFRVGQSFLFVSRVEEYVDKAGNPKALFWKLDYILDNLPLWLRPVGYNKDIHRSKLHIENPENGSVIDGESTTGNVARGDRRTAILLDEFAAVEQGHRVLSSTRDATNCRLFNSTPGGTNTAFYDIRQTDIRKLRLHWSSHPRKAAGLYTTDDAGALKILDSAGYPARYEPVLDGKLRSPWYDNECKRASSLQEIAQELDIDYLGSGFQYFNADAINIAIGKYARPPLYVGDLEYDDATAEPIRFRENPKGCLKLWCLLNRDDDPPKDHKSILGSDVAAGTGASNSCGAVWDAATSEKVAEYANPYVRPEQFAKQMVALARWLGNSYMLWESNGPGRQFGSRIKDLGYGNVYLSRRDEALSGKVSDIPGWSPTKEKKLVLMGNYRSAVEKGEAINRSKVALEETLEYVFGPDGGVEHSRASNKADPSGAKSNHGDRVIADALAWMGLSERAKQPVQEKPEIPVGSLAWRNKMRDRSKENSNRELESSWR